MQSQILQSNFKSSKAFSLTQVLLVLSILLILAALAFPAIRSFQRESDLNNSAEGIINALRLGQNKTLTSERDDNYGVYFSTSTFPQEYVLFKGENYLSRATSFDKVFQIPKTTEFSEIALAGGSPEIIFERLTGGTNQPGSISLRLKKDVSKGRDIYVEASGRVGLIDPLVPNDENRAKDSRHVHFEYNRQINTSTESLILIFSYDSSTTSREIVIADYIRDNQIRWEGQFAIEDEVQVLKIQTHRLNDIILDSQFSVHRDQRYNNRPLKIEISGDVTGDLIQYDIVGQTTKGNSIYVSSPDWQ